MDNPETSISFEEWVKFIFEDPVAKSSSVTVSYITKLFENAGTLLASFSDAQLANGLYTLVSPSASDHMFALLDTSVEWTERKRCIQSIYWIYEDIFAARCSPYLSHLGGEAPNPLNRVCYMWWDVIPLHGKPEDPNQADLDQEMLNVMKRILNLEHVACIEGALHGLGHWRWDYPEIVEKIIDEFMANTPELHPELKHYAQGARDGHIQ